MSSQPPYPPPGGVPGGVPPYDPRTQWKVYREQQKAAWRMQRDAWKVQRHAWKAGYGGPYGPRVPSVVGPILLIGIGVVGVLLYSGTILPGRFWMWYGKWWPLLLIAAGLALLAEWAIDLRRETPVRRSGGFVGGLILLAILGFAAAGWSNFRGTWPNNWGDNNQGFFNFFGLPEHDFDQQVIQTAVPANAAVQIQDARGDVSVAVGDGPNLTVQAHEVAYADSDDKAKKIFDTIAVHVTVTGNSVLVKSEGNDRGRVNLTVTVPKTALVTVNSGRGDVTAAGLTGGATITTSHGDVRLSAIDGPVQVHFEGGRGEFAAHQVNGDVTSDGNCNDVTLSEIKGKVSMNGEIFGDVHMETVMGPIHVHTSMTEMDLASLPGDLTLNSDVLRATQAKGDVRVVTHAKDVDLNQIYGDTYVDDSRGEISIEPAGSYSVDARNGKGDVEVTLPPNASGTVTGHTQNGDIVSDYPLQISGNESKTVSGVIGSGKGKITLSADVGDLRIRKGDGFPETPMTPTPPASPKGPRLKVHPGDATHAVTQ
ncbi:MAG TPA: DUF4097 family beta strand repeat-containing protein [Terracidiphilus sp.]|nr:DUF4097 family beta strand repeat-containing protein [Terracidiphilus sp.]